MEEVTGLVVSNYDLVYNALSFAPPTSVIPNTGAASSPGKAAGRTRGF